jgi:hypothetical protein
VNTWQEATSACFRIEHCNISGESGQNDLFEEKHVEFTSLLHTIKQMRANRCLICPWYEPHPGHVSVIEVSCSVDHQ